MPDARVTTVIPLHNHQDWILDAVGSVVDQDYPNRTIVVVNDGSTDYSKDTVRKYLAHERTGRLEGPAGSVDFYQGTVKSVPVALLDFPKASGPSFARNRGIEVALQAHDATYVAFLDSDDLYGPGKLSQSVKEFEKAPGIVGAVYSDFDTLRPDGLKLRQFKEPFSRERLVRECIVNCDSVVSRQAIETVGIFDEGLRVCEDYDLWLRLSERFLIVHIPESLVTVRVGQHSSTSTVPSELWQRNWTRVMQKLQERARA